MANFPFPNKISVSSSNDINQNVIIANYGDGVEQRAANGLNSIRRTWNVQINSLNKTDRDTMVAFYKAHGRVLSFNWTPPGETTSLKWVFDDAINETNNGCLYNFSMRLRQVFEV